MVSEIVGKIKRSSTTIDDYHVATPIDEVVYQTSRCYLEGMARAPIDRRVLLVGPLCRYGENVYSEEEKYVYICWVGKERVLIY